MNNNSRDYVLINGIQFSTTGFFGDEYYSDQNRIMRVESIVVPRPDVRIFYDNKSYWHRKYDGGITLVPGQKRFVEDESRNVYGFYEYVDLKQTKICINDTYIEYHYENDQWIFSNGEDNIAEIIIKPETERRRYSEEGFDKEERYDIRVKKEIDKRWYPLILATPWLGF